MIDFLPLLVQKSSVTILFCIGVFAVVSRFLSLVAGVAVAGSMMAPSLAGAAACFSKAELEASHVRQLQTEFMVAALTCEMHPTVDLTGKYNAFVQKYKKELGGNAKDLRGHFTRNYGSGNSKAFDAYMTTLANDASMRGQNMAAYCEVTDQIIDKVLLLKNDDLQPFATTTVASYSNAEPCKGVAASSTFSKPQLIKAVAVTPAKSTPAPKKAAPAKAAPAKAAKK